jgi:hypothetical protein
MSPENNQMVKDACCVGQLRPRSVAGVPLLVVPPDPLVPVLVAIHFFIHSNTRDDNVRLDQEQNQGQSNNRIANVVACSSEISTHQSRCNHTLYNP